MCLVRVKMVEEALHGGGHVGEGLLADDGRPVVFDMGNAVAGVGLQLAAAFGQAYEFRASVTRVGVTFQVAERLEVVDEL